MYLELFLRINSFEMLPLLVLLEGHLHFKLLLCDELASRLGVLRAIGHHLRLLLLAFVSSYKMLLKLLVGWTL